MANVLVVAEFEEGKVKRTTHSAITFAQAAAQASGGSFSILLLGAGTQGAAAELCAVLLASRRDSAILFALSHQFAARGVRAAGHAGADHAA